MNLWPSRFWSGTAVAGLSAVLAVSADAANKAPPPGYNLSSVIDYLKTANDLSYCSDVKDAFDRRKCERDFSVFRTKMLAWARSALLVDDIKVEVSEYDFRRSAFTLSVRTEPMGTGESDFHDVQAIGSQSCDPETEMPVIRQQWVVPMAANAAESSPLRRATGDQTVTALLRFTGDNLMWCCGPTARMMAAQDNEKCSVPATIFKISGWQMTDDPPESVDDDSDDGKDKGPVVLFKAGAAIPPKLVDFDVRVLGCLVPTGDGEFGKPPEPESDEEPGGDGDEKPPAKLEKPERKG